MNVVGAKLTGGKMERESVCVCAVILSDVLIRQAVVMQSEST